jgi:hypothetical protein
MTSMPLWLRLLRSRRQAGPTRSSNLAPTCRQHHRYKTHAGWAYVRLTAGVYLWHTPEGRFLLRIPEGTTLLSFSACS